MVPDLWKFEHLFFSSMIKWEIIGIRFSLMSKGDHTWFRLDSKRILWAYGVIEK